MSTAIFDRLHALLPKRPALLALGPDCSAILARVAPAIAQPHGWTFATEDDATLGLALEGAARWAIARNYAVTWPGRALLLHRPGGAIRIETLVTGPGAVPTRALRDASCVIAQAMLTAAPAAQLAALASRLHAPFLGLALPTGRIAFLPPDRADGIARRAWLRSLRGPRASGAEAVRILTRALAAHGFTLAAQAATVEHRGADPRVRAALRSVRSWAGQNGEAPAVDGWCRRRDAQAAAGALVLRTGSTDILATPPAAARTPARQRKGR